MSVKNFLRIIILPLIIVCFNPVYAAASIIIDAGSTGSRLHLFTYDKEQFPEIEDVFSEKVSPGLATFANKSQEEVDQYLKPLFDKAKQKLKDLQIEEENVSVSVLGTAGMRLIPTDSAKIYDQVRHFLTHHYAFKLDQIETITGKMEGLYGWLDINYLAKTFQDHSPSLGSIDMGGASTQIAFESLSPDFQEDKVAFTINNQHYTVFVKSFLELGTEQARKFISQEPQFNKCYPIAYPLSKSLGDFNFTTCRGLYSTILEEKQVKQQLPSIENQHFVAYSGVYYAYRIFDSLHNTEQNVVEKQIQRYCGEQDWIEWQQKHPTEPLTFLSNYCSSAVYITDLLYNFYGIKGNKLQVSDRINQQNIDWTLGVLLHRLLIE